MFSVVHATGQWMRQLCVVQYCSVQFSSTTNINLLLVLDSSS